MRRKSNLFFDVDEEDIPVSVSAEELELAAQKSAKKMKKAAAPAPTGSEPAPAFKSTAAKENLKPAESKKPAEPETLSGTYEEMFSNWHGKMIQAAELGDRHLAFMSLVSLNQMLSGIGSEVDIGSYDVLSVYDPGNLRKTAEGFETILKDYLREYDRAGLVANRVPGIDAFIASYLESWET
jgi:hypothetical protein